MIYDSPRLAAQACSLNDEVVDVIQDETFPRIEVVPCPSCANHYPASLVGAGYGMQAVIAECKNCRVAYQALRPSPEATLAYMNWRWSSSDTYVADTQSQIERAKRQLAIVEGATMPEAVLDFGAGSGSFVKVSRDKGYKTLGVERSNTAVANAQSRFGIDLQSDITEGDFNVVTLWDVVEHLRNPQATLENLRDHMQPGGIIFIETGNWESWTRLQEQKGWGLILLDHQYYFSPISLEKLVTNAGFKEFKVLNINRSRPRFWPVDWAYWLAAKTRWPFGDITIMIACARA